MDIEEQDGSIFTCNFCSKMFPAKLDLALHQISAPHIKRLKSAFLQQNFISACLACRMVLSDFKQVKDHLQQSEHKEMLNIYLKQDLLMRSKSVCNKCGLSFLSDVALEVHRTIPPHKLPINSANLPNINELVKQLGGLPTGLSELTCDYSCIICKEECKSLDDYIIHLFTNLHINCLRKSSCIICNKNFTHACDREGHLASPKHLSLLQGSTRNLINRGQDATICNNRGYLCMLCMVWCNSWPCFEVHLLNRIHSEVALKRKMNLMKFSKRIYEGPVQEGECHEISQCEESTMARWKKWRDESTGLSGWCHLCGTSLPCPDRAEMHLEDHYHCRIPQAGMSHPLVPFRQLINICDLFECKFCQVSFKSASSFTAHEALMQHYLRTVEPYATMNHYWCTNCGMECHDNVGGGDCIELEISPLKLHGSKISVESITSVKQHPETCSKSLKGFDVAFPDDLKAKFLPVEILSLDMPTEMELNASISQDDKKAGSAGVINKALVQHDVGMESFQARTYLQSETIVQDKMQAESSSPVLEISDIQGKPTKAVANNDNSSFAHDVHLTGQGICRGTSGVTTERTDAIPSGILLSDVRLDTVTSQGPSQADVSQLPNVSNGEHGKSSNPLIYSQRGEIPVVAAAIITPSESLQGALQSVMSVAVETLSTALTTLLPAFTSFPEQGKKHFWEADETNGPRKKACFENYLERALQHGLRSMHACPRSVDNTGIQRLDGELQENTYSPICERVSSVGGLQCGSNGITIFPRIEAEPSEGTSDYSSGNMTDQTNMPIDGHLALISKDFENLAYMVVAAAIVPCASAGAVTSVGNESDASAHHKQNQEKCAAKDKERPEKSRMPLDGPDGLVQFRVSSSMEAVRVCPGGIDNILESKTENRKFKDKSHPLEK